MISDHNEPEEKDDPLEYIVERVRELNAMIWAGTINSPQAGIKSRMGEDIVWDALWILGVYRCKFPSVELFAAYGGWVGIRYYYITEDGAEVSLSVVPINKE